MLSGGFKTFGTVATSAHTDSSFFAMSGYSYFALCHRRWRLRGGGGVQQPVHVLALSSMSVVFETHSRRRNKTSLLHITFFCLSVNSGFRMTANVLIVIHPLLVLQLVQLQCWSQKWAQSPSQMNFGTDPPRHRWSYPHLRHPFSSSSYQALYGCLVYMV